MERLSELEGVVLGMLWAMGPMTAYSIRQFFLKSPSPHWASSAGTIYPLVQRLDKRGFIKSEVHSTGRRQGLKYTVAPSGMKVFKKWIGPDLPPIATAVPIDSLRVRVRFMGALSDAERTQLLKNARVELNKALKMLEKNAAENKNDVGIFLAYRGSIAMMRSRLAWLNEVETAFAGKKKRDPGAKR